MIYKGKKVARASIYKQDLHNQHQAVTGKKLRKS